MYTKLTGQENSVVGVTVLLALLVLRQADFGIRTSHGLLSIVGIFTIMMAGPRLANMVSPVGSIFYKLCLYPASYDFWVSQCHYA